jgi:hypothetical protein
MNQPTNPPDGQAMYASIEEFGARGKVFYHCYASPIAVELCGVAREAIVQISIRAAKEGEETPYWGWWEYRDNKYTMIYPSKLQSDMCFTYGVKAAEEAGQGKQLQLVLELKGINNA